MGYPVSGKAYLRLSLKRLEMTVFLWDRVRR